MKRSADLLVEERVFHVSLNIVIRANADFAEHPGALVLIEHLDENRLVLGGRGIYYSTGLELQPDTLDFSSAMHCRKAVLHHALGGIFEWTGEDLAVRKIRLAVAIDPFAALDDDFQIRALW